MKNQEKAEICLEQAIESALISVQKTGRKAIPAIWARERAFLVNAAGVDWRESPWRTPWQPQAAEERFFFSRKI